MSNIEPELLGLLVKDANDIEGAEEIYKVLEGRYKEE